MGQEVSETQFNKEEFRHFQQALRDETSLLEEWIADRYLSDAGYVAGLELEMCLVDPTGNPVACNQSVLDALKSPIVVPELSKFNIEFNVEPISPRGDGLPVLVKRLGETWSKCSEAARPMELTVMSIGILPTLRDEHLVLGNMTELHRYRALNEQTMRLRRGKPARLDISGVETLVSEHFDVMLEAGATSLRCICKCHKLKRRTRTTWRPWFQLRWLRSERILHCSSVSNCGRRLAFRSLSKRLRWKSP